MKPILELQNVSLGLPYLDKPILTDIDLNVQPNDFIILLGSNGSGKSSLLKCIDRRYEPTKGHLRLDNKPYSHYSHKAFSQRIITLTQNCHESLFPSLTLFENYQVMKQRKEKNERLFLSTYLEKFNPNLPNKLDQIVDRLSGGEKQAFALALAVLYPPSILLLDEHTSALDPKSAEQLMILTHQVIQENNITCIMTTHHVDSALTYGNQIIIMRQGAIANTIGQSEKKGLLGEQLLVLSY